MSIRSSSGPDSRFWYLVTADGAQVQGLSASLYQPHGQGYPQSNIFFFRDEGEKGSFAWLSQSQLTSLEKHGAFSKTLNANFANGANCANFMVLFAAFAHSRHSR
jgi:hypothetical protein